MPLEMGLWRVDDEPHRIAPQEMPLESNLERLILADPDILEVKLLLLGSQVPTQYGKYVDLLGLDVDGVLHILELKRGRTPREVVAQALDYASWVQELSNENVRDIFETYHPGKIFDEAFATRFDDAPVPDELNTEHVLTIVASDLDPSTERIVSYLHNSYDVPINVMLFRFFSDKGNEYLARTWLIDEDAPVPANSSMVKNKSTKATWNGRDWYVSFGADHDSRSWDDARQYGFVSAGGGDWYSQTLRGLPVGARIFVNIPPRRFVGVGIVKGPAAPADETVLDVDGEERPFRSLPLKGNYFHKDTGKGNPAEYVVPVRWLASVPMEEAFWRTGLFANQHSACRLRSQFTIDQVSQQLGASEPEYGEPLKTDR